MLLYVEYYNYRILYHGMWCGYRKLGDYFYLNTSVDYSLMQWGFIL